jgi:hypothetical protein
MPELPVTEVSLALLKLERTHRTHNSASRVGNLTAFSSVRVGPVQVQGGTPRGADLAVGALSQHQAAGKHVLDGSFARHQSDTNAIDKEIIETHARHLHQQTPA